MGVLPVLIHETIQLWYPHDCGTQNDQSYVAPAMVPHLTLGVSPRFIGSYGVAGRRTWLVMALLVMVSHLFDIAKHCFLPYIEWASALVPPTPPIWGADIYIYIYRPGAPVSLF